MIIVYVDLAVATVHNSAESTPEGCTENPYHSIAVTVLACFCTDQELVTFNDHIHALINCQFF